MTFFLAIFHWVQISRVLQLLVMCANPTSWAVNVRSSSRVPPDQMVAWTVILGGGYELGLYSCNESIFRSCISQCFILKIESNILIIKTWFVLIHWQRLLCSFIIFLLTPQTYIFLIDFCAVDQHKVTKVTGLTFQEKQTPQHHAAPAFFEHGDDVTVW